MSDYKAFSGKFQYRRFLLCGSAVGSSFALLPISRLLKNVGEEVETRPKQAKKRSLRAVNEHFEPVFNAVSATQVVFQRPVSQAAVNLSVAVGCAQPQQCFAQEAH